MNIPLPTRPRLRARDRFVLILLLLLLSAEVFGGILRYYLTALGAPWAVYVPKLLIVLAYFGLVLNAFFKARISRSVLGVLMLFAIFLLLGVYFTQSWIQPAFGVFVLLPLLFAVLAEPALSRLGQRIVPYAAALWLSVAVGVIYDYLADVPWVGLTYDLGSAEVEAARSWTAFGVERVAGFSRASYEAAGHLLFLALPLVILGRRKSLKWVVWLATGMLIVLTTTKKSVGVYLFLALLLPAMGAGFVSASTKKVIAIVCPILVVLVGIALPVSTLIVDYRLDFNSFLSKFLFASFEERLVRTWPEGFNLVATHGHILLGRGIGGIGVAQKYFESEIYTYADNLYLYLYATFGVSSLFIIYLYAKRVCRVNTQIVRDRWALLVWFWSIAVLMSGWATNGIEGAFTSCLLGITLAYANRHRRQVAPIIKK